MNRPLPRQRFSTRQFKAFQDDFDDMPISETVATYIDWQQKHEQAQAAIRENYETPDRDQYYAYLTPHIEDLNKIHTQLSLARESLNKKRQRMKKDRRIAIGALVIALVAVVIGTFAWISPEFFKKNTWQNGQAATAPPNEAGKALPRNKEPAK